MEVIELLSLNLIYVWILLDEFLKNPENKLIKEKLQQLLAQKTLFDKQCFELSFSVCQNEIDISSIKDIEQNLYLNLPTNKENIVHLNKFKNLLEKYFESQVKISKNTEECLKQINKILKSLEKYNDTDINEDTLSLITIIYELTVYLKTKISCSEENLNWSEYSIYLLVQYYFQFFKNTKITDNHFPEIKPLFDFYSNLINKKHIPVFVLSDDSNVSIDPFAFPDEIHFKIFELLNIEITYKDNPFIISSLDKNFAYNSLIEPLFCHEIGHLLDINFTNIERFIINRMIIENPVMFQTNGRIIINWLREIIADSVAVCFSGPAYFYVLISHFKNKETLKACDTHPGVVFRSQILYKYLFQNEFIKLLSQKAVLKIETQLNYLQKHFNTSSLEYIDIENFLQESIGIIYQIINKFMQNADVYFTSAILKELINKNNNDIEKTKEQINSNNLDMSDLLNLQNINWLIELEKGNTYFMPE